MRPLRLTMRAFGPYAGEQVVDFQAAMSAGLFGIYGPTGSGKSSIFSAICFALFGEPARADQDASTLRSDHAKPDCLTEVEFIFEIGSQRYLVRRRPEQMRPSLRGDKETRELHCAWLFDVTGIPLDEITPENQGIVIAEKKTSEVREELQRRLGYGAEQFRQIVLLPQGRFEAFLSANTNARLEILRDLFDVSLYKRLTQKMKDDARAAEEKIRSDRQVCRSTLEQEGFETLEELSQGVQQTKDGHQQAVAAVETAKENALRAEQQFATAKEIDKAFAEHTEAVNSLASVRAQSAEIEREKSVLKGAIAARGLTDVDRAVQRARADLSTAKNGLATAQVTHAKAKKESEGAAVRLAAEQGRRAETELLRERCGALSRHRETLEKAEKKKADTARAADQERNTRQALQRAQEAQTLLVQKKTNVAAKLKTAEAASGQRAKISAALQDVRSKLEAARLYEGAGRAVMLARGELDRVSKEYETLARSRATAQQACDNAELALAGAQAQHLAGKLKAGEPCPVCGSPDHPSPAQGHAEGAGRNDAFIAARRALDTARKAEEQGGQKLAAARATLEEREANLSRQAKPEQAVSELDSRAVTLQAELDGLGPTEDLELLRNTVEDIERRLPEASAAIDAARTESEQARTTHALANQALADALASVPEGLRERVALESAISAAEQEVNQRDLAFNSAVSAERVAREKLIVAAKDEEIASKACHTALANLQLAELELSNRLAEHGLTAEAYVSHKANINRIDALEARIDLHERNLAAAEDRLQRAQKAIEGKERPEMSALRVSCEEAGRLRDEALQRAASTGARAEFLENLAERITAKLAEIKRAEDEYAPLAAVAQAFSGQNQAKTELEAFAIASMFDLVLSAANARLKPMSGGRYTLERELEVVKGAGKRGLGIVVHDVHTGRTRATTTLSGGETFMAALALALGLSDVVENVNGGVRLDTIFIDEGFGTLDPETLDQALQTLQDVVGESRAVGIISHVDMVQQAIPHGFRIDKTASGSRISQHLN